MLNSAIILLNLLIICLNQKSNKNIAFDYKTESYFEIIGITVEEKVIF